MKRFIITILTVVLVCGLAISLTACGRGDLKMEGSVRNAVTNEPMAGVTVTFDDDVSAKTNEKGLFAFEGIRIGDYTVSYELDGFKPLIETYDIQKNWFAEVALQPSNQDDSDLSIDDGNEEQDSTVKPVPPGDEITDKPNLKVHSNLDNFKVTLSSAPPSASTKNTETIETADGVIRVKAFNQNQMNEQFEIIIDGNTIYDKDPQSGEWFKHTEPSDPNFPPITPVTMIIDWFNVIDEVISTDNAKVTGMESIKIDGATHQRYYLSGIGKDVTHSFKGEIFILEGYIVGFDGNVSTGDKDYQKATQYVVIYDIGKVKAIEIPANATSIDNMDWGAPKQIPPEEMPIPPEEGMPKPPPIKDQKDR